MKRIDLVRHLEEFGCEFVREGKQHTLYINRRTRKSTRCPDIERFPPEQLEAFVVRSISLCPLTETLRQALGGA